VYSLEIPVPTGRPGSWSAGVKASNSEGRFVAWLGIGLFWNKGIKKQISEFGQRPIENSWKKVNHEKN
jgi:hypothetical protein